MLKTKLIEIAKKIITWDKKLEIYSNGEGNDYPERMERYRVNSVTATMASKIMKQYVIGKGFGEADNLIIGGNKLIDIALDITSSIVDDNGVFIHVGYNANFEVSDFKVVPFKQCRIGEKDSQEYNGKILVYKDWNENKIDKNKIITYNVFNPNKDVIKYQAGIKDNDTDAIIIEKMAKYKGQIFFYNAHKNYYYPLSRLHSVAVDCDSEYLASKYKNQITRRSFFGKTLVITRPLLDDSFIPHAKNSTEYQREYARLESEVEKTDETLKQFMGADNAGGILRMEVDYKGDKLEDAILFKNIETDINDKVFEFTEKSVMEKILMAHNNLPISLVKSPDNALLGNSGESLNVLKQTYWENNSIERNKVETIVNDFLRITSDVVYSQYLPILPLITKEITADTALIEKQKAQATLKGSVGGVTALLEIIRSVSAKETDYNSALAIIQEIYGVDEAKSRELLGTPNAPQTPRLNTK